MTMFRPIAGSRYANTSAIDGFMMEGSGPGTVDVSCVGMRVLDCLLFLLPK